MLMFFTNNVCKFQNAINPSKLINFFCVDTKNLLNDKSKIVIKMKTKIVVKLYKFSS